MLPSFVISVATLTTVYVTDSNDKAGLVTGYGDYVKMNDVLMTCPCIVYDLYGDDMFKMDTDFWSYVNDI